jgi:hypothetical protein
MGSRIAIWSLPILVAVATAANGAHLSVGTDPSCTHSTLAEAVGALPTGSDESHVIRMMSTAGSDATQVDALNRNLEIVGGFTTCPGPDETGAQPDAPPTVLSGAGGDARPVLSMGGGSVAVTLRHLRIVDGDATRSGGGLSFNGAGSLELHAVEFVGNRSEWMGGGLYVESQGITVVTAGDGVVFRNNTAGLGGGIFLRGRVDFRMNGRDSLFEQNVADGGGAIRLNGPVRASIGATAVGGGALFRGNRANVGSAISVHSEISGQRGALTLYSIDSRQPLGFVDHRAVSRTRQSAVVHIYISSQAVNSELRACAWDLVFEGNLGSSMPLVGVEGAGASFMLNSPNCLDALPPSAARCIDPSVCSRLSGSALDDSSPPDTRFTNLLQAWGGATVEARAMSVQGNRVASIVQVAPGSTLTLADTVVGANDVSRALFDSRGSLLLDGVTIADNLMRLGSSVVSATGTLLDFRDSIVHQPGTVVLTGAPAQRSLSYLGVHDVSGLPSDSGPFISESPLFSDPKQHDWRQRSDSPLVDIAPARGGTDRAGLLRDVDTLDLPNIAGPRDLGAFESPHAMSGVEYLFEDAFE